MATIEPRKLHWKDEEITTSLSDEEAAKLVESKVDSEFAKSLVSKFKSQSLSTGQLFWLHKLAEQAATISQPVEVGGVFQAVTSMMEKASTKLQKPRIRILAEEQQEIKLYPADSDSKYAGSIMVYAVGGFLGTIDKNGTFRPAKGCPAWVIPALQKFANNPHHTAQEYGTLTGRCCFCYQRLSTETSLSLGYGPICARNYGLLK